MSALRLRHRVIPSLIGIVTITVAWNCCCANVIYQTGFEQPNLMPGLLDMPELPGGQDGWQTMFEAFDAAMIADGHPESGKQSLQFDGDALGPCCGFLLGTGARWDLNYDPSEHDFPVINVRADMQLDGPNIGGGPANDLISVNLTARTFPFRPIAAIEVSSSGEVSAGRLNSNLTVPIELGQYYNLGLRLDYAEETSEFFVNGDSVGMEPFLPGHAFQELLTVTLELLAVNDPGKIDPADYTAYIDNLIIYEGDELPLQPAALQAGDADQDMDFDQLDLVRVQQSAKYLTGQLATWGEGDWNGAPGGSVGSPPPGDGVFDQLDIVSALATGLYSTGPFAAVAPEPGDPNDDQTSLVYNAATGELSVNAAVGKGMASLNSESADSKFIGEKPDILVGGFDKFDPRNIFNATFGRGNSFGAIGFGPVLPPGLSRDEVVADLTAVGVIFPLPGDLEPVDLVYVAVPEPSGGLLLGMGLMGAVLAIMNPRWTSCL